MITVMDMSSGKLLTDDFGDDASTWRDPGAGIPQPSLQLGLQPALPSHAREWRAQEAHGFLAHLYLSQR